MKDLKFEEKEYEFNVNDGQILNLYAKNPRGAKLKASNWEKWLVKTGRGNDKVIKDSIHEIIYENNRKIKHKIK